MSYIIRALCDHIICSKRDHALYVYAQCSYISPYAKGIPPLPPSPSLSSSLSLHVRPRSLCLSLSLYIYIFLSPCDLSPPLLSNKALIPGFVVPHDLFSHDNRTTAKQNTNIGAERRQALPSGLSTSAWDPVPRFCCTHNCHFFHLPSCSTAPHTHRLLQNGSITIELKDESHQAYIQAVRNSTSAKLSQTQAARLPS